MKDSTRRILLKRFYEYRRELIEAGRMPGPQSTTVDSGETNHDEQL